jgi:hypothetical protein
LKFSRSFKFNSSYFCSIAFSIKKIKRKHCSKNGFKKFLQNQNEEEKYFFSLESVFSTLRAIRDFHESLPKAWILFLLVIKDLEFQGEIYYVIIDNFLPKAELKLSKIEYSS